MFRKFIVELVVVGIVVGWAVSAFLDALTPYIPWLILVIVWHLTWELFGQRTLRHAFVRFGTGKNVAIAYVLAFVVGGIISIAYWWGINSILTRMSTAHEVLHNTGVGVSEAKKEPPSAESGGTASVGTEPIPATNISKTTNNRSPSPTHPPTVAATSIATLQAERNALINHLADDYQRLHPNETVRGSLPGEYSGNAIVWIDRELEKRGQPPLLISGLARRSTGTAIALGGNAQLITDHVTFYTPDQPVSATDNAKVNLNYTNIVKPPEPHITDLKPTSLGGDTVTVSDNLQVGLYQDHGGVFVELITNGTTGQKVKLPRPAKRLLFEPGNAIVTASEGPREIMIGVFEGKPISIAVLQFTEDGIELDTSRAVIHTDRGTLGFPIRITLLEAK